jgi:hypothetical protein
MLEMMREGSTLYEWGVGEMANHMGYNTQLLGFLSEL